MMYEIVFLEEDHKEDITGISLPGCTKPGDIIRLGQNLYKILELNRKGISYVKVSFHKSVEKKSHR